MRAAEEELRLAVRRALRRLPAAVRAAPPLVGCSGGPDSLALLLATHAERPDVVAAIVDHGLQEGSAERSAALAESLRARGVTASVHPVLVDGPGGPEAAARRARYAALEAARPHPRSPILLAHTLDDQAETVLLGLGRGSGARSIAGMAEWAEPYLRPLLATRRAVTHAACAQAWSDPHNSDPRYTRVRIRREVLPALEAALGGGAAEALARTAAQLREDDAALTTWAAEALHKAREGSELSVAPLRDLPAAVRRRTLRTWLTEAGATELTDAHLRAADALVGEWRGQGGPRLPGGLDLVREDGRLAVHRVR
jgi:tRNA(Ile)-lysidine synthase